MEKQSPRDPESEPDEESAGRVEDILWEYVERLNRGETVEEEAIRAEHPDMAGELIHQLQAFQVIGSEAGADQPLGTLGDYTLRRQIGRGGMGVVYEAWENSMDRRVALKVLPRGVAADTKSVTRFVREAQVAGKLNHPGVVPVYGMGITDQTPYYAMEFVEGETLAQALAKLNAAGGKEEERKIVLEGVTGAFATPELEGETLSRVLARLEGTEEIEDAEPERKRSDSTARRSSSRPSRQEIAYYERIARAFADVAEGLHYAHSKGVVHRDIKPSNLIVDRGADQAGRAQGRLRILDFGLAQLEGQEGLTLTGEFLGTPLYMSPEQAMSKRIRVDHRTDIYSLGATLYEMLAFRPPFQGKDHQDTLSQIIFRDPAPLRRQNQGIPKDLETIVLKCLRKDPGGRYRTAEALSQDLRRFAMGEPIEARPQSVWEMMTRRAWRNRWRVGAAFLIALLLLTSGLLVYDHWREKYESELDLARAAHRATVELYEKKVRDAATKIEMGRPAKRRNVQELQLSLAPASAAGSAFSAIPGQLGELLDPVEEAERELEEAVELFPEKPDAHYHLARALLKLERKNDARRALEKSLECDSRFVPALMLYSILLEREGEGEESRRTRELAQEVQGEWTAAWRTAYLAVESQRWEEAIEAYTRLIDLNPAGSERYLGFSLRTRLGRGRAFLKAEDHIGALEDFAVAHAEWPEIAAPVLLAGRTYYAMGQPEKMEKSFQKLLGQSPDPDSAALQICRVYLDLEQYARALEWAEKAAESPEREYRKTVCLYALGRYGEMEKAARRGLELDPDHSMLHNGLAIILGRKGEEGEAIAEYRKALLDPKNVAAPHNLAIIYKSKRDYENAEKMYRESLARGSRHVWTHQYLGEVLQSQGRVDEAETHYRKAVELDRTSPHFPWTLGRFLVQQGRFKDAIGEYCEALKRDPGHSSTYESLRNMIRYHRNVDFEDALKPLVETLESIINSRTDPSASALETCALYLAERSSVRNVEKALEYARLVLERREGEDPEILAHLAGLNFAEGNRENAILTMERAVSLPGANLRHERILSECRRKVLPDLVSYASVEAAMVDRETLVPEGAEWRFFRGKEEPSSGLDWTLLDFDDASWEKGVAGFGERDGTVLSDMKDNYFSLYVRRYFDVPDPRAYRRLRLVVYVDDAFVAYLNGTEVGRINAGRAGERIPFDAGARWGTAAYTPRAVWIAAEHLRPGKNCLALQGLQNKDSRGRGIGGFVLHPILEAELPVDPGRLGRLLEAYRPVARKTGARARLAYLEGRILQCEGKHDEAVAKFEEVLALDRMRPEPFLRLTDSCRILGDLPAAEAYIREALKHDHRDLEELRNHWFSVSAWDLDRGPGLLLETYPRKFASLLREEGSLALQEAMFRWSLEQIKAQQVRRIPERLQQCGAGPLNPGPLCAFALETTYPWIWRILRGVVSRQLIEKPDLVGGEDGAPFEDVPDHGALLTGLEVTAVPGELIVALRPIFLNSGGRLRGNLQGVPGDPRAETVEARPGYAVGGLRVRADAQLRGLQVLFMRIREARLDPDDTYASDWLGSDRLLDPVEITGRGNPAVGIRGRSGTGMHAIGLVFASSTSLGYPLLDGVLEDLDLVKIIPEGAQWSFFRGREEPSPGLEWTLVDFDDSSWETGPGGFGHADGTIAQTALRDMKNKYRSLYLRHRFDVPDPRSFERLRLVVRVDDGFVAYLNGTEVCRLYAGPPGERVAFDAGATGGTMAVPREFRIRTEYLRPGRNCLSLHGLQGLDRVERKEMGGFVIHAVLEAELPSDPERPRRLLEAFRALGGRMIAPAHLKYLEGRVLQGEGRHADAVARFDQAILQDRRKLEPYLRAVASLRALGDPVAAEKRVLMALESGLTGSKELLKLWLLIAAVDLKRDARELLSSFPEMDQQNGEAWTQLRRNLRRFLDNGIERIPRSCLPEDGVPWNPALLYASAAAPGIWQDLRKRVRLGLVRKGDPAGGTGGRSFEDTPGAGALLTGFEFSSEQPQGEVAFKAIRPLFLTSGGSLKGTIWGDPVRRPSIIEARPGYAVGGVVVNAGDVVGDLKILFMRIGKDGLDTGDAYESSWLGNRESSPAGNEVVLGGNGEPVIGIHGRCWDTVDGIGLVTPSSGPTYQSIDRALEAPESLIAVGATWRFFRGLEEPSSKLEWTELDFDDSSWETGPSPFCAGYEALNTGEGTYLPDMTGSYPSLYVRRRFSVSGPAASRGIRLVVRFGAGFVAYLNGTEVGRENAGLLNRRVPFDVGAQRNTGALATVVLRIEPQIIQQGENCLALQGLNWKDGTHRVYLEATLEKDRIPDSARDRRLLEDVRVVAGEAMRRAELAYFEGRVLQRQEKYTEASVRFEEVLTLDRNQPEPFLRIAECLRARKDPEAAEIQLRNALQIGLGDRRLWNAWFRLVAGDLKREPAEILAALPSQAESDERTYGQDLRWLVEQLKDHGALRINCGGEEYRSPGGTVWGRDRFYSAGLRFPSSAVHDAVHKSERYFPPVAADSSSYRFPVPPGRYRVGLHFAEIWHRERGKRVFAVALEGDRVLENYEPLAAGFAVPERKAFDVEVRDGLLDIEFIREIENPKVSAIEIERIR